MPYSSLAHGDGSKPSIRLLTAIVVLRTAWHGRRLLQNLVDFRIGVTDEVLAVWVAARRPRRDLVGIDGFDRLHDGRVEIMLCLDLLIERAQLEYVCLHVHAEFLVGGLSNHQHRGADLVAGVRLELELERL